MERTNQFCRFSNRPSPNQYKVKSHLTQSATPEQSQYLRMKQRGILSLATHMLYEDQRKNEGKGPFATDDALTLIVNTLLTIPDDWITLILTNKLHRLYKPGGQPYRLSAGIAAVYGLVLCGPKGEIPTEEEMDQTLEVMTGYIHDFGDESHHRIIDNTAAAIDSLSPNVDGRCWTQESSSAAMALWKTNKGVPRAHPRRYCHSPYARQWTKVFIEQYKLRHEKILVTSSLYGVGFSKDTSARCQQHLTHQNLTHQLERLLEATLFYLFPEKEYFLRFTVLCPVWDAAMAPIAEHVVCLLASASHRMGGLNGKDCGDSGMATVATRPGNNQIWQHAVLAVSADKQYIRGSKTVMEHVLFNSIMTQWPNDGDEVVSQAIKKSELDQMTTVLDKVTDDTLSAFCAVIKHKIAKLEKLEDDMNDMIETIELRALEMLMDDIENEIALEESR